MKKRIFSIAALFLCALIIISGTMIFSDRRINYDDIKSEQIVALNEIEELAKRGDYEKMSEKTDALAENIRQAERSGPDNWIILISGIAAGFIVIIFGYIYFAVLRPFGKLKAFAQSISQGDFDVPLNYERSNYFGEFTWAFDCMRNEITKSRANEKEAIENNKTIIATLSHDIKTPIASIRAYSEGLEANMDTSPEKRRKYAGVIMRKCDEVAKLTNDLFLHSLSNLDKLKIVPETFELCGFLSGIIEEIAAERNDVSFRNPRFSVIVTADKNRLTQIAENLINNARKYAKTDIEVFITRENNAVNIHFRDYGGGIPDEDMPFIFDKFYRGRNCANEQGSGLGLYIVKYLAEKMGGVTLHNRTDGLEAVVTVDSV